MNDKICPIHTQPWKTFTKDGASWESHKTTTGEWCNKSKIETQTAPPEPLQAPETVREPIVEEKVDWASKDRQSMAQTAMNSASEIIAALITVKADEAYLQSPEVHVKDMANEFYKELKQMKTQE